MKLFECQACGNVVHFDSLSCVSCGHRLGYLPDPAVMTALEEADGGWRALADGRTYLFCDNARAVLCNWLRPASDGPGYCRACRHTRTVPDLADPANGHRWRKLELAKRRLFYSLTRWRLPTPDRIEDPQGGLAFDFLAETTGPDGGRQPVLTGHAAGVITIDVAEADDAERESRRTDLGEPFRTLLGHFRHEVGHFYWDRLVAGSELIPAFRSLFGDERIDYAAALRTHYAAGPRPAWPEGYVSAYATAHPWEDFAETFAHYVHMVDGLETGRSFGMAVRPSVGGGSNRAARIDFDPYEARDVAELVEAWVPFTVAVNAVNRSLGQPDLYPFVLGPAVVEKLAFVHDLIRRASDGQGRAAVTMNSTL